MTLEEQLKRVTAERDALKARLAALTKPKPPVEQTHCTIHYEVRLHNGVCMVCDLEASKR